MLLSADCGLEDLKYGILWPFAPKSTYVSFLKTSEKVYTSLSCCLSGKVWFSFSVCVYFCEVILKISCCKILNNIFYLRKNWTKLSITSLTSNCEFAHACTGYSGYQTSWGEYYIQWSRLRAHVQWSVPNVLKTSRSLLRINYSRSGKSHFEMGECLTLCRVQKLRQMF